MFEWKLLFACNKMPKKNKHQIIRTSWLEKQVHAHIMKLRLSMDPSDDHQGKGLPIRTGDRDFIFTAE